MFNWLKPPVFAQDDEKTHTAGLVNSILLSALAAALLYVALAPVLSFGLLMAVVIPLLLLLAMLLVLLRRGHVKATSLALVWGLWLILLYASYVNGGVRAPGFGGLIVVVMIAAFLVSARFGMFMAGLSVLAGVVLILLETNGWVPVSNTPRALFAVLMAQVTYFIVAAVLLALATRSIKQALTRAVSSEERYRLIASLMSDYVFSNRYGPNGEVVDQWLGGAFETITGYSPEAYFAQGGWLSILHPEDWEQDARDMALLYANQQAVTEVRIIRKDGSVRWVRVYGHPVWDAENDRLAGMYGAVQDITARKQMELDLRRRADEMALLYQISLALSSGEDLYHALRAFVKELKRVMTVDAFHIGLYDEETDLFSYSLFLNLDQDLQLPPRKLNEEPGLTWEVILKRRTLYLPNVMDTETRREHNVLIIVESDLHSYIGIPLMLQERVIGVMSVQSVQAGAYQPDQIRLLEALAAQVVITMEKANLLDQVKQELVERTRVEGELRQREAILETVTFAAEQFLKAADWRGQIDAVLERLGREFNASHAYLFEKHPGPDGSLLNSLRYEWVAPGQRSDLDNPAYQNAPMNDKEFKRYYEILDSGEPFIGGAAYFRQAEGEESWLETTGIKALLEIRIVADGEQWGTLGFDDMVNAREWTPMEVDVIRVAANVLGAAIQRQSAEAALQNELDERKKLIEELKLKNAESETLRESVATVAATLEQAEAIDRVLEQLERVVHYNSASVQLLNGGMLEIVSARGLDLEQGHIGSRFLLDESEPAYPVMQGWVPYVLFEDVQPTVPAFRDAPHDVIHAWMAVPLKVKGGIIGIIALDGYQIGQFSARDAGLAVTYANQVAIALENARLFGELQAKLSERQKLISELENKNSELERFTYTVSHDLKSPLVTINGFLGYLEQDALSGNTDRLKRDLQRISEAVGKMQKLLNELLELSRIGRVVNASESVPFEELVREASNLVIGQLEARRVTVAVRPNLPVVQVDRPRLVEVMQNLLDNAAKYMGGQARPHIEVGQRGEDAESGMIVFFFKDNGIGIAPEFHERVFGLFNKLDPRSEGTGVGLALVRRIIEVHGGRIWVESEAGQGSTFLFTLPTQPNSDSGL